MKNKRTDINFSKHEFIKIETPEVSIYHLKIPNTNYHNIKYINCSGILAVTGDFGNWIFCREFHPTEEDSVSDGYWLEKLKIASSQEALEFDSDATKKALQERLEDYKQEKGENIDEDVIEYYEGCINMCYEHELDYTHFAYRERPSGIDYEDVILIKDMKFWLKAVFDGFEEMCHRIKNKEN